MRSKTAIAIIAAGCVLIAGLFVVRQNKGKDHQAMAPEKGPVGGLPQSPGLAETNPAPGARLANEIVPAPGTNLPGPGQNSSEAVSNLPTNATDIARAARETYVNGRISTLQDLAMDNAASSLDAILAELTNNDPQIRKAALEATIQFASRDAIPRLTEVAAETQDAEEKAAINEAIEFLKLPSLTEVLAANKNPHPANRVKAARPVLAAPRAPVSTQQ